MDCIKSVNSKCSPSQKKHRVMLATSLVMLLDKQTAPDECDVRTELHRYPEKNQLSL